MDPEQVSSLFEKTGQFDELEIRILSAVLAMKKNRHEKFSANQIAGTAGISVTNTYKYLYSLQQKGFIESIEANGFGPKKKLFWLSNSSNPIPRLFAKYVEEFVAKKKIFSELEETYAHLHSFNNGIWMGHKIQENFSGNFPERAAFIIDSARKEILISTPNLFENFLILDSIKRAAEKGIIIKIITTEADAEKAKKLEDLGIEIHLGRFKQRMIVSDEQHGIEIANEGVWFLNSKSDFKKEFLKHWALSEEI